jgi:hypothetical protein
MTKPRPGEGLYGGWPAEIYEGTVAKHAFGACGKRPFCEPFLYQDEQCTKTGSGQTWENLRRKGMRLLQVGGFRRVMLRSMRRL